MYSFFLPSIIIKCKALFSCHWSSSHYSTQGFLLISFYLIFFKLNKFIHFYMQPTVFFQISELNMDSDATKITQKISLFEVTPISCFMCYRSSFGSRICGRQANMRVLFISKEFSALRCFKKFLGKNNQRIWYHGM